MKLYLTPGACSLADHIALTEAGIDVETIKVDLQTRRTEHGDDFVAINPKGYVPALVFDDGEMLTENVAIMDWIAGETPHLAPKGRLGRSRNIEMLAFLATEIHRPFMRLMFSPAKAEQQAARQAIIERLALIAEGLDGIYLFGDAFTTADALCYVMVRWARDSGFELPDRLTAYAERIEARPAVQKTLRTEGLA
ncbi:glutathione S-transferase [Pseudorhizobium tarimense]|uniref:Glutathione S-transferase n=1 Tax=Pseudorhizobium tarimense TaxID=1079109 RepID=A0ABV2H9W6_9HYPH|nr:glutathione S-transferase N-terminal domain-containing protein [Pseudorhizobium tarimense]MCJ8520340.1 glutathione S-transferase N-terminal domain-containing protein [Pseudorhizobium tarimense]